MKDGQLKLRNENVKDVIINVNMGQRKHLSPH